MTDAALFQEPPEAAWPIGLPARDWPWWPAVGFSLALHLTVFAAATVFKPPAVNQPEERRIDVELLDASQFDAVIAGRSSGPPAEAVRLAPEPQTEPLPEIGPDGLIVARTLRSAAVLDDPRNAKTKAAMPSMRSDERMVQLCSLEAMEQVAALGEDYQPDLIVSYAMDDVRVNGNLADAPGAAVRSQGHWYNLRFKCAVTLGSDHVIAFSFRLGEEIPEDQWEAHDLAAGTDPD